MNPVQMKQELINAKDDLRDAQAGERVAEGRARLLFDEVTELLGIIGKDRRDTVTMVEFLVQALQNTREDRDHYQKEINRARTRNCDLSEELEKLRQSFYKVAAQRDGAQAASDRHKAQVADLLKERDLAIKERDLYKDTLTTTLNERDLLRAELIQDRQDTAVLVNWLVENCKRTRKQATKVSEHLDRNISRLDQERNNHQTAITLLQADLAKTIQERNAAEQFGAETFQELIVAQEELSQARQDRDRLQGEVNDLRFCAQAYERERDGFKDYLDDVQMKRSMELKAWREDQDSAEITIMDLHREIKEAIQERNSMEVQWNFAEDELAKVLKSRNALRDELNAIKATLASINEIQ